MPSRMTGNSKRKYWLFALHLVALANLAVAYPVFQSVGNATEFFLAHECNPALLISLVFSLALFLPMLIGVIPLFLSYATTRIASFAMFILLALFIALLAMPALKQDRLFDGWLVIVIAVLFGSLVSEAYRRFSAVRDFFSFLLPAILVIPGIFLLNSEVAKTFLHSRHASLTTSLKSKTPIIFVIFDEFPLSSLLNPSMEIDSVRFPNFARLQKGSTWFRNASSHFGYTTWAITAILTGNIPRETKPCTIVNYPNNLFTLLEGSYELRIYENVSRLNPLQIEKGLDILTMQHRLYLIYADLGVVYLHKTLPAEYTTSLPSMNQTWGNFWLGSAGTAMLADRTTSWKRFFESLPEKSGPTISFLHVMLPHYPWRYFPSGKRYGIRSFGGWKMEGRDENGNWLHDKWSSVRGLQKHLLQVAYVDHLIGDMIDKLKKNGVYDDSLIVITADHGISFIPGQHPRKITPQNYYDILPIPLFIKRPRQTTGIISDRNVETSDILPTLVDALKLKMPWKVDGISALNENLPEKKSKIALELFGDGLSRRLIFPAHIPELSQTVQRIAQVFGTGTPIGQLLKIGVLPDLIGKPIAEIKSIKVESELMNQGDYDMVVRSSGYIPAMIAGKLSNSHKTTTVAISVNGTIQGVTETILNNSGEEEFSVLVSEDSFQDGKNNIEVFEIPASK